MKLISSDPPIIIPPVKLVFTDVSTGVAVYAQSIESSSHLLTFLHSGGIKLTRFATNEDYRLHLESLGFQFNHVNSKCCVLRVEPLVSL